MYIKDEFSEKLEKIIQDVQDATQQMRLLREYRIMPKSGRMLTEYGIYFETLYSYLHNYVILSFFKLYEDEKDCISIYTLRRCIERNFEQIFDDPKQQIENPKTKEELLAEIKAYIKSVKPSIDKIWYIRNKAGLAHGMPDDFSVTLSFEELERLTENTQQIVNCIYARYANTTCLFGEGIIQVKALRDLVDDYEMIPLPSSRIRKFP